MIYNVLFFLFTVVCVVSARRAWRKSWWLGMLAEITWVLAVGCLAAFVFANIAQ